MIGGLRSSRRKILNEEETSPLEGAINIVDAMLVFACGLMLSLIINWNVDLEQVGERIDLDQQQEVTDDQEIRNNLIENQGEGDAYQRMGTVYKDPITGQLFMLTEE